MKKQCARRRGSVRFQLLAHRRTELPAEIKKVFGCKVAFGSDVDEVIYPQRAISMATVNADSYLNSLLVKYCEEALSSRREQSGASVAAWASENGRNC
jgi:hypothetical protein